ncbi:MAG: hypothetical protein A2092_12535 [Rhodobacteraceae bacterium GWE1_64_9]|nr:MAG: hypothetical protein A2092_12535 [Rhodobacteraceae bacterium GWE1_64_9]OHC49185.1 MAG: hypothetical protein A2X69_04380 [Rhodobacteraceae bacterium GWF1_65_7]HBU14402.1 hypothetical protein [Gemmobacter sp.]
MAGTVAGCTQSGYGQPGVLQTQGGRAVTGAVIGAAIADATDENMVAGASLGALAGGASCGLPGLPRCY